MVCLTVAVAYIFFRDEKSNSYEVVAIVINTQKTTIGIRDCISFFNKLLKIEIYCREFG